MDRSSFQERFGIIGKAEALRQSIDRVRQVAKTEITVLIEGESGVGKELFAHALHQMSDRRHKVIQLVNCGAIPEGLIESELFGAEKGAYTGAVERRSGYFEQADGGTIFLDEIGEMPLGAQVRLLRVLETGHFSRVGSSVVLKSDVRVIAATNKNLAREVKAGRFREDLYYRLSTVIITVPSLRERREDILTLFDHFQHRFAQQYNSPSRALDTSAKELLVRYRWPGNVRELRNVAEQVTVLLRGDSITAEDVRPFLRGVSSSGSDLSTLPVASGAHESSEQTRERELIYRALLELRSEIRDMKDQVQALVALGRGVSATTSSRETALVLRRPVEDEVFSDHIEDVPFEIEHDGPAEDASGVAPGLPTLEDAERRLITEALERFEGNRRQTAKALGISERTLYRKIKEFDEDA